MPITLPDKFKKNWVHQTLLFKISGLLKYFSSDFLNLNLVKKERDGPLKRIHMSVIQPNVLWDLMSYIHTQLAITTVQSVLLT